MLIYLSWLIHRIKDSYVTQTLQVALEACWKFGVRGVLGCFEDACQIAVQPKHRVVVQGKAHG